MKSLTAGQIFLESLRSHGVEYVFGVVGHTFLGILDAFYDSADVKFIGCRHEQSAALMADGYARATGKPGVSLVVGGAGATNTTTAIAGAYVANSPVIAFCGGTSLQTRNTSVLQEMDLVSSFKPITKLSTVVNKPHRIAEFVNLGFRTATRDRKGPVYLEIPQDVSVNRSINLDYQLFTDRPIPTTKAADRELITTIRDILLNANKPLLLVGEGCTASNANQTVEQLATRLNIPMVSTYGHNDVVSNSHPLYIGPLGRAGAPESADLCKQADTIVAIGTKLGHFDTYYDNRYISNNCTLIQIDIDATYLNQIFPTTYSLTGDINENISLLLESDSSVTSSEHRNPWIKTAKSKQSQRLDRLNRENSLSDTPIKPQKVYSELRKVLPKNTIVSMDAGGCVAYGYDRLQFHYPRTFFSSLDLGCIGWGYGIALGAKMGKPESPVVSINGDGGYLFHAREIATAVQHNIPVISIVMNNNAWGSEKVYQKELYQGRYVGADITNPRFDKLAELFGGDGYYIQHADCISDTLIKALGSGKPSVIEIPVDPEELPTSAHSLKPIKKR